MSGSGSVGISIHVCTKFVLLFFAKHSSSHRSVLSRAAVFAVCACVLVPLVPSPIESQGIFSPLHLWRAMPKSAKIDDTLARPLQAEDTVDLLGAGSGDFFTVPKHPLY